MNKVKNKLKNSVLSYFNSFKQIQLKSLAIDLVAFGIIFVVITQIQSLINFLGDKFLPVTMSENEVKAFVLSSSTQELAQLTKSIKIFVVLFFLAFIIGALIVLYTYAYSRRRIWHEIVKRKLISNTRWIMVFLVSLGILAVAFLPLIILNSLIILLAGTLTYNNPDIVKIINAALIFLELAFILLIYISIKFSFSHTGKVWRSIGDGFAIIKKKFKPLLAIYPYLVITLWVLNFAVLYTISKVFPFNELAAYIGQLLIFILFLSWARIYFYQTIKPTEN